MSGSSGWSRISGGRRARTVEHRTGVSRRPDPGPRHPRWRDRQHDDDGRQHDRRRTQHRSGSHPQQSHRRRETSVQPDPAQPGPAQPGPEDPDPATTPRPTRRTDGWCRRRVRGHRTSLRPRPPTAPLTCEPGDLPAGCGRPSPPTGSAAIAGTAPAYTGSRTTTRRGDFARPLARSRPRRVRGRERRPGGPADPPSSSSCPATGRVSRVRPRGGRQGGPPTGGPATTAGAAHRRARGER